jgi:NADH-quinone oxidoreductase subunit J
MVLVGAEFIAMLLVIVYVGAVAVLFLFVVMMLDIDFAELRAGFGRYMPVGVLLAIILAAEIIFAVGAWQAGGVLNDAQVAAGRAVQAAQSTGADGVVISNTRAIGQLLYTRYVFLFEAAGLILLVAMIGAIVLTNRKRTGVLRQNVGRQNARRPQDATRLTQPVTGQGVEL